MLHFTTPKLVIVTTYGRAQVCFGRYPAGGAIAIWLVTADDGPPEPLGTFSTNLVPYGARVSPDEFNVKTWAENEPLVEPLFATGIFERTNRSTATGYVISPIWRITDPRYIPPATLPKAA